VPGSAWLFTGCRTRDAAPLTHFQSLTLLVAESPQAELKRKTEMSEEMNVQLGEASACIQDLELALRHAQVSVPTVAPTDSLL